LHYFVSRMIRNPRNNGDIAPPVFRNEAALLRLSSGDFSSMYYVPAI